MSRSGRLIGSLHTITHASHKSYVAACCNTALVVQCIVIAYAKSASAAAVTRYQASLRSPHNALHSPSYWGERSEAPHGRYIWDFPYIMYIYIYIIIDVRRTALILRCGAVRVDLLRMLIVV